VKLILSREQSQAFDARTMQNNAVPGVVLMENAGRGAADLLLSHFNGKPHQVLVVAGPGNNGGDGFVVARRLKVNGHHVEVALLTEPLRLTGDAKVMWDAYVGVGGEYHVVSTESEVHRFEESLAVSQVVVDALFGTGLVRHITGLHARIVELVNAANVLRVALDVPSGLDASRGIILGIAIRADVTVTFGHEKFGLLNSAGVDHAGQLELVDIGVPAQTRELGEHVAEHLEINEFKDLLIPRSLAAHKGSSGRVGLLAGHPGTTGAALLCARGALRMGAGLVTHLGLPDTITAIESRVLEAMTRKIDPHHPVTSFTEATHGMDALVVGPGLGLGHAQTELVGHIVEHCEIPVVLDADALTFIASNLRKLRLAKGPRVLLPHRGEMARLLQCTIGEIEQDPLGAMAQLTDLTHATVLLKGAYSFVASPGKKPKVVGAPCPVLSTGGTGDVLAGMVGALLVDHDPLVATLLAAYLHSRAGALWKEAHGSDRGLLASELAELVPAAVAELSRPKAVLTD
jgi:ADP-dependent NAD(P)H-hydrate dehydratase / NAD(P)H-hydrate epimerase